jgi:hypothetical protein
MRELVKKHKTAIETHTTLSYEALQSITYLYEFDRVLQFVVPPIPSCWIWSRYLANR